MIYLWYFIGIVACLRTEKNPKFMHVHIIMYELYFLCTFIIKVKLHSNICQIGLPSRLVSLFCGLVHVLMVITSNNDLTLPYKRINVSPTLQLHKGKWAVLRYVLFPRQKSWFFRKKEMDEGSENMNIRACFSKIILSLHRCIKVLSFGVWCEVAVHSR